MPNLRIIFDNIVQSAVLLASSTAGGLAASNLLTDVKTAVHRSTGTSVVYTLTWAADQALGAVALPATNLTTSATIRVQTYSDEAGAQLIYDTGVQGACPSAELGLHGWGPINANAFAFGGASKVAVWLPYQPDNVRRCVITLDDPDNPAGYIDCSRLVVGPYWEAEKNPDYGASAGTADLSKFVRAESGDSVIHRGACYQTMSLNLTDMSEPARATFAKIVRSAGAHRNLFFSLLPDNADATAEQDHMIYGRRANGAFSFDYFNGFSTRVEIEGW